ncbi:MAG: glycosyltransferase [Acidimicrobiales bacterium]
MPSPGAGSTWRGYEVFAVQLTRWLRTAGIEVLMLTGGSTALSGAERVPRIERGSTAAGRIAGALGVRPHTVEHLSFAAGAVGAIRRFGPDAIVASESVLLALWRRAARVLGTTRPVHVLTNGGSRRPPFAYADGVIHHAADLHLAALACEPAARHTMLACPVPVPSPDEVAAARAARVSLLDELGVPSRRRVVVVAGSIDRRVKRVDHVVADLAAVADDLDLHLLLLGAEPKVEAGLVTHCRRAMPGRVAVREVPFDEMGRYYAAADLHVSASLDEGFGRVFVEAQAWGTPSLVHDTDRARQVLGGQGVFVDTTQPGAIARALPGALDRRPTERARENVAKGSWEALGPRYVEFIEQVVAGSR